ncbi:AraC family transcriptional regulator [Ramlibacter rhizophilus]|uniref:AraC family transcriptional regulator n=1 Tax=Ramlibacter rhizophilus TaxID=1781167 RepID=A0A4Z0BVZ3_9BURK|nr:helix-turn-helix transcriptional regulator [Ramlibacter rhizophilus]TFZ03403.1 AraC family transcriptional regulator [Ramlibacter rhizophilus]
MNHRKTDTPSTQAPPPLHQVLKEIEAVSSPVAGRATDYPPGWHIAPHTHTKHQLIYAVRGVMVVQADAGHWVVPPTRAIWMEAGMTHAIRCVGAVHMRSLMVAPEAAPKLLNGTQAVGISTLLRELIRAAMDVRQPYVANSRDGRLMRLILDELRALPVLPLHLQMPSDARLVRISEALQQNLGDASTVADWAQRLRVDAKTIQRLFVKETGMTFGQWRQQARLLRALQLLATGDKVIDVALALGYDSPSAFASMFRKQLGETPSAFFAEV